MDLSLDKEEESVPNKMSIINHYSYCRCPCCVLIANNVNIMDVHIDILRESQETNLIVPNYEPYIAYRDNPAVSTAMRQLILDYSTISKLKVGESTLMAGDYHEFMVFRTKRNSYMMCFRTTRVRPLPQIEAEETDPKNV
jgi:hypothetical protein